jgi:hypothetical protein
MSPEEEKTTAQPQLAQPEPKPKQAEGDFASGERTSDVDESSPDFARGERTSEEDKTGTDFAAGERTLPEDPEQHPDFARGQDAA